MGFIFAARLAGKNPKITPIAVEQIKALTNAIGWNTKCHSGNITLAIIAILN